MARQNDLALERATMIRLNGAAIRRDIAALPPHEGTKMVEKLLMDPPLCIQRMKPLHLLKAIRRLGPDGARKMLYDLGVHSPQQYQVGPDHNKQRKPMSTRQREELVARLRARRDPMMREQRIRAV